MPTLIPYARQSRTDEASISLDDQVAAIRAWADRAGVDLADPIMEASTSGNRPWRERELGSIIKRLEAGEADGIAVAYFSRLTREKLSATFEVLEALEPFQRVYVDQGRSLAPGERQNLLDAINGAQSHDEWQRLRGHLKLGKHRSWERGLLVNSLHPAGYRVVERELLKDPTHSVTVAKAIEARAFGASVSEVARILTAGAVPTRTGETVWSVQAVRGLLRNPTYAGIWRCACGCGRAKLRPELALVPLSIWKKAQPAKSEPTARKDGQPRKSSAGRKDPGRYLLSGLLRCATCGMAMSHSNVRHGGKLYENYRCTGGLRCTKHASISAATAEPLLIAEALHWFTALADHHAGHDADVEALARLEYERDEANERLAALVRLLDPLDPGAEERLAEARSDVKRTEDALLAERTAQRTRLTDEQVREMFETASVDEQRRLLRLVFETVRVKPGRASADERIEVEYANKKLAAAVAAT